MSELPSLDEVVPIDTDETVHALLGNGFSRACRDDIFAYDALFEQADFAGLSVHARAAFATLKTTDFEAVMTALRHAAELVRLYDPTNSALSKQLREDADGLREVLVQAIAGSHPARPHEIPSDSYERCRRFLSRFKRIYTVNYDLLLYWALMQSELGEEIPFDDGFRTPESGPTDYVTWEPWKNHSQTVYYLHGGLHIFDAKSEVQKYTWINTGVPLIDQIRQALEDGKYPLFVAEGETAQKLARVRHSDYLARALKSFANIGGTLVVYGHSFATNDDHIFDRLAGNQVRRLVVGIYGDPDSADNKRIRRRAEMLSERRSAKRSLDVSYFDAASAEVW
ncbi:MAG: DUF4917 family protein [Planctomycetota bacterium]